MTVSGQAITAPSPGVIETQSYAESCRHLLSRTPPTIDLIVGSPEYWTVLYWCFVTLSTLGLGDYPPKTSRALSVVSFYVYVVGGISLLSLVVQYLQERALPRSVTGA